MIDKIIERLEGKKCSDEDAAREISIAMRNVHFDTAIDIVRQVASGNLDCKGCCFYDDGDINKHENYDSLTPDEYEIAKEDLESLLALAKTKVSTGAWLGYTQSVMLATQSLEKQIPKTPIMKTWQISKCPCCGAGLGESKGDGYHKDWTNLRICECGQKLNWGER